MADFNLVVVRQFAGNGGERFTLTSIPRAPTRARMARSFSVPAGTTTAATRAELLRHILRLLYVQLSDTDHEAAFSLAVAESYSSTVGPETDPWNHWVLVPELGLSGDGGSNYYQVESTAALTLRRLTSDSKTRFYAYYQRNLSSYRLENGERIYGDVFATYLRGLYALAIGEHWSAGGLTALFTSQLENYWGHVRTAALVEYNLFPYTENAERQLRFAYQGGVWANRYHETSVGNRLREVRPFHALSIVADVNQAWGSVQLVTQFNSFIDSPRRYRLAAGAVISIRLLEGLSANIEGSASLVQDLINLRSRTITDRELLLGTAQQPTEHTFELSLSVAYTFGSVHNTIVNPRFGQLDLEEP